MRRVSGETEVWADGYSFMEFRHGPLGLVPYHYEARPSGSAFPPPEAAVSTTEPIRDSSLTIRGYQFTA